MAAFCVALLAVVAGAFGVAVLAGGSIGALDDGGDDHPDGADKGTDHGGGMDHGDSMDDGDGMDGEMDHGGDMNMEMRMVDDGVVVNGNSEELPPGCDEVSDGQSVTIRGGYEYAEGGESFAFDRERIEVEPCTRVTVTFVNEDSVRHQWMLHGLPTETYPMGMFNVEVDGPGSATGTFVTPAADTTLDTHCSLPQHEQKGMHMSVVVGDGGDGGDH